VLYIALEKRMNFILKYIVVKYKTYHVTLTFVFFNDFDII